MTAFTAPYPVMLDLTGRRVLVVGGGKVGAHKSAGLVRAGAAVTVVSPTAVDEIAKNDAIRWHQRRYERGEVASYALAITATDDAEVNAQVARDALAANIWVNSADDPTNCSFILPAVVTRGDLQVAISTNGKSPAMARWARQQLEQTFTDDHRRALDILADVRAEARTAFGTSEVPGWDRAIDQEFFALVTAGYDDQARQHVRAAIGLGSHHDDRNPNDDRDPENEHSADRQLAPLGRPLRQSDTPPTIQPISQPAMQPLHQPGNRRVAQPAPHQTETTS